MGKRNDAFVTAFFTVDFGNHLKGDVLSIDGVERKVEVVKQTQANAKGQSVVKHTAGNSNVSGEITIKRNMTSNMDMWTWRKMVEEGKMSDARVNGTITLFDMSEMGKEVASWTLDMVWPSAISGPDMSAKANESAVETLTLQHEGLTRTK